MSNPTQHMLQGKSACGGTASGRPRIVRQPSDLDDVSVGDILVAVETDIGYVPAMQLAAAVITEAGGRFCHAAVWARENSKPTVIQVEDATILLAGAQKVAVDATAGVVEWVE